MTANDPNRAATAHTGTARTGATSSTTPDGARPAPTVHAPEGPQVPGGEKTAGTTAHKLGGTSTSSTPATSIGELVAKITAQFSALVRDEIKFAGVQLKTKAAKSGVGGALFAVAGVLALYAFGVLLLAAGYGIAEALPLWLSFLIVGLVLLLICGILAFAGSRKLKSAKENVVDPKKGLEKDVNALKKGFEK